MSNFQSYQKYEGAAATSSSYSEISNNGDVPVNKSRAKWLIVAGLLAIVGVGYAAYSMRSNPGENVKKELAHSNVQVGASGKLKLFDDQSKFKWNRMQIDSSDKSSNLTFVRL
jgi:hypothetical protein